MHIVNGSGVCSYYVDSSSIKRGDEFEGHLWQGSLGKIPRIEKVFYDLVISREMPPKQA